MRDRKKKRTSRVCDEDNIPLKMIKKMSQCDSDPNSYDVLMMPSSEPCGLCDRVSKNRYYSIIHNVKHIIIPLLNQTVHQCDICLHHFTSQTDLIRHKGKKHSLSELLAHTDLVKTNFNRPTDGTYESDLITIIKKEKGIVEKEEGIVKKDIGIVKKEVGILRKDLGIVKKENAIMEAEVTIVKMNDLQTFGDGEHTIEMESACLQGFSLKNRLVFEDDIISFDSHKMLNDLTTDCQVQVEQFPPIWNVEYTKSVHHEDLIKPGVFKCKQCVKRFPSRYEAIIHESTHIVIKNSQINMCDICNQYILGDYNKLRLHILTTHPKYEHPKSNNGVVTSKQFGGKSIENGVSCQEVATKTAMLKLCEICFAFCKNRGSQNYDCVGELSEIGKRYTCEKCGFKFFVIKLVKRRSKYRLPYIRKKTECNNKRMSNEARLKMIRHRFKMMKQKYFWCFIFT